MAKGDHELLDSECVLRPPPSSYLLLPTGRVDSSQTRRVQESALMEADADEVRGTVGRCAHQNTAVGQKVVNLVVQVTSTGGGGVRHALFKN